MCNVSFKCHVVSKMSVHASPGEHVACWYTGIDGSQHGELANTSVPAEHTFA